MTSRSPLRTLAIALAAVAGLAVAGLSGPAAAQNSDNQQSGQQSQQQTPDYSDAKLESFAVAAAKVRTVMQEYRPQLREARQNQNREQFEKVRMEARNAVEQEIAATEGISSREYQQIAQDARNDENLRQKVLGMMKSQQQDQGS
jgi:predicted small lipoprotein YifL